MKHDGLEFRLAKHLTWRRANPALDKDLSGNPVGEPYVAIVCKKDCTEYPKNGQTFLNVDTAPSIPMDSGGTYYGYGKKHKRMGGTTRPVYLVRGNRVYAATIRYEEE